MSDNYQAVYDAVRSRFNPIDSSRVIDAIASCFDFSNARAIVQQELIGVAHEYLRPSVLFRPKLSIDGDQWCALYGDNLQDGIAGFGDTADKAMLDFDKNFNTFGVARPEQKPLGLEMADCLDEILNPAEEPTHD